MKLLVVFTLLFISCTTTPSKEVVRGWKNTDVVPTENGSIQKLLRNDVTILAHDNNDYIHYVSGDASIIDMDIFNSSIDEMSFSDSLYFFSYLDGSLIKLDDHFQLELIPSFDDSVLVAEIGIFEEEILVNYIDQKEPRNSYYFKSKMGVINSNGSLIRHQIWPDSAEVLSFEKFRKKIFAFTYENGLWELSGNNWSRVKGPSEFRFTRSLIDSHMGMLVGTWNGIYRKKNEGEEFEKFHPCGRTGDQFGGGEPRKVFEMLMVDSLLVAVGSGGPTGSFPVFYHPQRDRWATIYFDTWCEEGCLGMFASADLEVFEDHLYVATTMGVAKISLEDIRFAFSEENRENRDVYRELSCGED